MSAPTNGRILQACHEACGQPALEQGRACVSRGDVVSCRWDPGRKRLFGEIEGEAGKTHEVTVDIVADRRGLRIEGDCSCPEGYNCLHVAALIIEWLHQRESGGKPRNAVAAWRSTLRRYHPRSAGKASPDQAECLLYRISISANQQSPRLDAEVSRVRRLKKGGFGKPARISPAEFSSYRLREIKDANDEYILALLQGLRDSSGTRMRVAISGELGALALGRMVESGRCFVADRESGPLTPGPNRALSLNWVSSEAGLKLTCDLPDIGTDWLLAPTDPGYYIHPDSGQCGRIDGDLSGTLLAQLRQLPALSPFEAEQIARDLVTGEIERHSGHAVVLSTGGYGNVFFLTTNSM